MKIVVLAFLPAIIFSALPGDVPDVRKRVTAVMSPTEELVYEVSWTWFKLGKIRVRSSNGPSEVPGSEYNSAAYSDSYDLPFVDFHAVSTSEMDSLLFSVGASLYENNNGRGLRQRYFFDPATRIYVTENANVASQNGQPLQPMTFDTMKLAYTRYQDGTSILYYARAHVHDQKSIRVPTLVRGKAGYTNFYFPGEQTSESIEALPYPVRTVEFDGLAEFEGIFGLTGEFTGWFTDDAAAVPIKAKMKVLLGSILIELKEWNRPGWNPPRAE